MVLSAVFVSPVFLGFGLIGFAVTIFCIVDIARRPAYAWTGSGQSKSLWLVLVIVGHFLCWFIMDLVYLLAIRPKVAAAQTGGGPMGGGPGGYGGGPYGGGQYGGGQYGGGQYGGGQYGGGQSYSAPSPGQYGGGQYGAPSPGQYGGGQPPTGSGAPGPAPTPPPPPGWYPDPGGSGHPRYWDGKAWAQG